MSELRLPPVHFEDNPIFKACARSYEIDYVLRCQDYSGYSCWEFLNEPLTSDKQLYVVPILPDCIRALYKMIDSMNQVRGYKFDVVSYTQAILEYRGVHILVDIDIPWIMTLQIARVQLALHGITDDSY